MKSWAEPLLRLICEMHAAKIQGCGLEGGKTSLAQAEVKGRRGLEECIEGHYTTKHMCRHFLLAADDADLFRGADGLITFDVLPMSTMSQWLPDEKKQMQNLWSKSAGWVRLRLGINPLLTSCHLCFAQLLPESALRAIRKAPYPTLAKPVREWLQWRRQHEQEVDAFPPNFCNLGYKVEAAEAAAQKKRKTLKG